MKKDCTTCAHRDLFEGMDSFNNYQKSEMLRCWSHPDVCDHPRVTLKSEAKSYVCENYISDEDWEIEQKEIARSKYFQLKKEIETLEKQYPEFKK